MLPTSRAFFVSYAGILLAGAIPVPIYPPFRADRIEEYAARQAAILNNAEVCLLLTFRRAEAVAHLLEPRVRSLHRVVDAEKLIDAADKAPPPAPGALPAHLTGSRARRSSDIALLQYTSGSTGDPKGVVLTHANLLANMRAIGNAVQMGPGDVGVSWLPLYHDMGLIGAWLTLLHFGVPLAVMSPLAFLTRPERWLWAFHKHRGTIAAAPNFAYELCVRKIADKDIEGLDLSSWRVAMNGAEPVNPETMERFTARFAPLRLSQRSASSGLRPRGVLSRGDRATAQSRTADRSRRARNLHDAGPRRSRPSPAASTRFPSFLPARRCQNTKCASSIDTGNEVPDRTEGFLWFRGPSATSWLLPQRHRDAKNCCHSGRRDRRTNLRGSIPAIARIAPTAKSTSPAASKTSSSRAAAICIRTKSKNSPRASKEFAKAASSRSDSKMKAPARKN